MRAAELDLARTARDESWDFFLRVQEWWSPIPPRLASLVWLCFAMGLELGARVNVALAVTLVLWFVALVAYVHGGELGSRLRAAVLDVLFFAALVGVALVALPGFVLTVLFHPERAPRAGDGRVSADSD